MSGVAAAYLAHEEQRQLFARGHSRDSRITCHLRLIPVLMELNEYHHIFRHGA